MAWLQVPEALGGIQRVAKLFRKNARIVTSGPDQAIPLAALRRPRPEGLRRGEPVRAVGQEAHGPSVAVSARALDANRSRVERCRGAAWRLGACAGWVAAVCMRPRDLGMPGSG